MDFLELLPTLSKMRVSQLRNAVYKNFIFDINEISTISKTEKEELSKKITIVPFESIKEEKSKDGSTKWALKLSDGNVIETVLLQFRDGRNTVCISSQAGCPCGCLFCATGQNGFKRNLSAWEIISQVLFAGEKLKAQSQKAESDKITNVVFMGMGEPMLNLDNVLQAISELNNPEGFGLGARHITVSTCGILPALDKFIEKETRTTLAISLHAPDQKLREKLMPISKNNPLGKLMILLDYFVAKTNKRISYEYILLDKVNDSEECARKLAELLCGRLAHVNLIRFNKSNGLPFSPASAATVERFKRILEDSNITVTTRVSLGGDISAACGQLSGKLKDKN